MDSTSMLPIIEFSGENSSPGSPHWLSTGEAVVRALEEHGCFIANYLNFSQENHNAIFCACEDLFRLPPHIKALNTSTTPSHGYVGQEPVIPLYEGLGIENATTLQGVKAFTNLLWPSGNDRFFEAALEFARAIAKLDQVVMRMVAETYGIQKSYDTLFDATTYLLRMIKYEPPRTNHEGEMGIIPHTDKSFMSILHQHQVSGLEIRLKDERWVTIEPSPSSFIVMAGDACMAWTNGRIEPPYHRVTMKGTKERYSLGLFSFVRDAKIEVPNEMVEARNHPLQFKTFDHYEYLHFYHSEEGMKSKCPIRAFCGV